MWAKILLFSLYFSCVLSQLTDEIWDQWKRVHGKVYNDVDEDKIRRTIWEQHACRVNEHNLRYQMGLETYTMELNRFADLSWDEFKEQYLSPVPVLNTKGTPFQFINKPAPESVDWREKGLVGPVQKQGSCVSSWAFATVGTVEGQYKKHFGKLEKLSEQQLVDCSKRFGNQGCSGGFMENAYEYLKRYSLETAANYPYHAKEQPCQYDTSKGVANVTGYMAVHDQDEVKLKYLVGTMGPAAVAIDVEPSFQLYKAGLYSEPKCSSSYVNHGVLVVGYGRKLIADYWIVKNSWGPYWGEDGYIRMVRNNKNMCGIATAASVPLVVKA